MVHPPTRTPHLTGPAVSTAWLAEHLGSPGLVVLDGSWYLPTSQRNPREEFGERRIPGARFFDMDGCSEPDTGLPHTVPSPARFSACAEELGVANDSVVVVYDGSGVNLSAPRVWWTFRYFGHSRIAVLDGGIEAWVSEGRPTESGPSFRTLVAPEPYVTEVRPDLIRSLDQVREAVSSGSTQVVDMRPRGRFEGTTPEPREGLRGGHIPGSRSLPYRDLVDVETGLAVSTERVGELLEEAGIDPTQPIVGTCGSGTSACAFAWNLARTGRDDVAIYDGSWSEWGAREDVPVATGPPGSKP